MRVSIKQSFFFLLLLAGFLLSVGHTACASPTLRVEIFPRAVKQGDLCLVRVWGPASCESICGEFRGEKVLMDPGTHAGTYEGLVGIDMGIRPGAYEFKVTASERENRVHSTSISINVEKVDFGIQRLSLPSSLVDLDTRTLERVRKEADRLERLFKGFRNERLWSGAFLRPVQGEVTGAFGLRRMINGRARSPHSGIDIQAEKGTPVLATNNGVAVLVDQLFFSGKSVILDHGAGLYSVYFHLSEILAKEGEKVLKGAPIGRVGSTGRSTAPHLHWGVRITEARVDPRSLLALTGPLAE